MDLEELKQRALSRVGRVLAEKWTLLRLVGVGGSAAVYEAAHRNGRRVAIKMLHEKHADNPNAQKRFLQEAYAANRVAHPGLVQVHDDGADQEGTAFLVLELLRGQSVAELQRACGTLGPRTAVNLVMQALDAVAAAHAGGVIHRDLKPANLFLTDDGVLKVLDFGIARMTERPSGASLQTVSGNWLGTPAFAAPEQARGRWEEVDERSDVWALGATLFTLLTGRLVYEAQTTNEQLGLAMTTPARSLGSLGSFASSLTGIVDRALSFEKQARFPSASAMRAALARIAPELNDVAMPISAASVEPRLTPEGRLGQWSTLGSSAIESRSPARPPNTKPWVIWALAGTAIALAVALQLFWQGGNAGSAVLSTSSPASAAATTTPAVPSERATVPAPPVMSTRQAVSPSDGIAPVKTNPTQRQARPAPPPSAKATAAKPPAPRTNPLDIRD